MRRWCGDEIETPKASREELYGDGETSPANKRVGGVASSLSGIRSGTAAKNGF